MTRSDCDCDCGDVAELLSRHLSDDDLSDLNCPVHQRAEKVPIPATALNDNPALAAIVLAALTETERA